MTLWKVVLIVLVVIGILTYFGYRFIKWMGRL